MSRIIDATCLAGVVKIGDVPVINAEILSQGVKASQGVLAIDRDKCTYITSNASDIKDLITSVVGICDQLIIILNIHDGALASAGAAAIAQLTVLKTALDLTKEQLK